MSLSTPPKLFRRMLLLTAAVFLLGAADSACARNGGHSNDNGGGRDHGDRHSEKHERSGDNRSALREVRRDKDGDKHAEKHKDKDRDGDKHAEKHKDGEKHKDKEAKQADKSKDQGKTSDTTTAADGKTPAAEGSLFDHGVVGKTPTDIARTPIDPGTGRKPTGNVTVSNGKDSYEISNGPGGVAVYSGKAGTITVTNGKESRTLNGGSVTLSGNVIGVGAAQNVQVSARNGEGRTTIAIRPQEPAPPAGNGANSDDSRARFEDETVGGHVLQGILDFGYGVSHGFSGGPAPPPKTSTSTQQ